jgi:hypothetical protein
MVQVAAFKAAINYLPIKFKAGIKYLPMKNGSVDGIIKIEKESQRSQTDRFHNHLNVASPCFGISSTVKPPPGGAAEIEGWFLHSLGASAEVSSQRAGKFRPLGIPAVRDRVAQEV